MNKPGSSNSDQLMIPVDYTEDNNHHMNNSYGITEQEIMITAPSLTTSLTTSSFHVSSLKTQSATMRTGNSSEDYLMKNEFIHSIVDEIPSNLQDMGSRLRYNRTSNVNPRKLALEDPKNTSSYTLKNMNNEIQDLSFSDDLRSLNRAVSNASSFNQYFYKTVSPSVDVYNTVFTNDLSNDGFTNSLPPTSPIFPQHDANSTYAMPENQSDELLLNSIELNDNEKLILSNEELAMLTHGKQGSCLELILNNGEILYAVIDSENDYNPPSPRLMLVPKEMLSPVRQCSVSAEVETNVVNPITEAQYNDNLPQTSNFTSRSPRVNDFNTSSSDSYHSVIPTSLSKPVNSSPVPNEHFNLCCNFSHDAGDHFPPVMDSYQSIVSEKTDTIYNSSLLRTVSPSTKKIPKEVSKINSNNKEERVPSKLDYFPSAVNSIVVSETGKKYPKKYSFYSNNFSLFLNQESYEKDSGSSNIENLSSDKSRNTVSQSTMKDTSHVRTQPISENMNVDIATSNTLPESSVMNLVNQNMNGTLQVKQNSTATVSTSVHDNQKISEEPNSSAVNVNLISKLSVNDDENMKNKFLNSRLNSVVNSICDTAVQSRARASLPSSYLSINRIKTDPNSKKLLYGVFARTTISCRTQFGPVEGVLIKLEEENVACDDDETTLQLTVESEKGVFLKLDVSNEEVCNWMKFVRPARTYKEQNLIVSQQESCLYFTTIDVIQPKQELLVWYSAGYSRARNYKLLPGDPAADIPCENIDFEGDSSVTISAAIREHFKENNVEFDNHIAEMKSNDSGKGDNSKEDLKTEKIYRNVSDWYIDAPSTNKKSKQNSSSKKGEKSKKSLWLCTSCDLTFSNASVMNLHMLVHALHSVEEHKNNDGGTYDGSEKHECPQCNQEFLEKKDLITHVSKHGLRVQRWTNKKTDQCFTEEPENLTNNLAEMSRDVKYECRSCNKNFKNPVALKIHKRFHSDDSNLECPMCEMTFKKLLYLKKHVHTHAVDGVFTCPHCPRKYDCYRYIRKHIRACHSKITYCCKLCKKSCKSQYKLRNHMLRHTDEREFLCAICGKLFKRMDKLSEHIKNMHSEEREKKRTESRNAITKKAAPILKNKSFKKNKLPSKYFRLIAENVDDFFYKCYVCNLGFRRRGMLVNHLNLFHPGVSLDSIPELNVPILKAFCNFYCLYCDKVYKSNSKRKEHILKTHPGAKIPTNSERGCVLDDPYAKQLGSVISTPFNCEFCYRQYASRAKLLHHRRNNHADKLPANLKSPRNWNSQKKKKKTDTKVDNVIPSNDAKVDNVASSNDAEVDATASNDISPRDTQTKAPLYNSSLKNEQLGAETSHSDLGVTVVPQNETSLQNSIKENVSDVNQQIVSLTHLLNEELRNSATQEQYLKILQSGITVAQTEENSAALLQQILASYSFSNT